MKSKMSRIVVLGAALIVGAAACTDVTTEPKSTVTDATIFNESGSYRAFLAKLYAGLVMTGQRGCCDQRDIESITDAGFTSYTRLYWNVQELPTDEAIIGWGDDGLPQLNTQTWSSSNPFLAGMFARVYFQVGLANQFLRETSDQALANRNVSPEVRGQIQQFRAEARFLRALSYWHGIDLFGDIPLVTETDPIGSTPPDAATRVEIFEFILSELNAIRSALPAAGSGQYGRADQGAVAMLQAKLLLNAETYGAGPRHGDVIPALQPVLSGPYRLANEYRLNFLADNHTSPELIFTAPQDGERQRAYSAMTVVTHAAVGGDMDASRYGLNGGWWGLRVRPEFVALFPGGASSPDRRASSIFFTEGHTLQINNVGDFRQGYAAPKYRNVTSTGRPGSDGEFPDIDFPMFRLADAYLMYAEAVLRGGGGSRQQALTYVNQIRARAYGGTGGAITDAQLTLPFIIAERGRELYWEGHRRTDLIRFGLFTGGEYLWAWKGNVQSGTATPATMRLYPIPATQCVANPKLKGTGGC